MIKRPWREILFTLIFFGLVGLLTQLALATYTPPKKISTSTNDTILPQLVTDNGGYIHLVWFEADPSWSAPNPGAFYSRWNGDTWSTPVNISGANTGFVEQAALAVDSSRRVHVVYDDWTGGYANSRVFYTRRETDGSWTPPEVLPHPGFFDPNNVNNWAWNARIAVDTSNNLHVIYSVGESPSLGGSFYYLSNNGTGWTTPTKISYDTDKITPLVNTQWGDLFADKQGNVHAVFWDWGKGIFYRKLSAGSWSDPYQVTSAPDVEYMRLTVDDNGNPYVAWFQTADDSVKVRGQISGVWQTEETLKTGAMRSYWGYPILGITTTSKNMIAVGWGEPGAGEKIDIAYRYNDGAGWTTPEKVRTETINSDTPWLFRDLWDNQHLVWTELNASGQWELWYSIVQGKQQTVGTAGGTVAAQIGTTKYVDLTIPKAALSADTLITILIGPLPESVDPLKVTIPRAYTFGPSGQTFAKAATAVFTYTVAELAGADPRNLGIYVWDTPTSSWSYKTGTVSTVKKTVTVDLNNFSLLGLSAPKFDATAAHWLPPLTEKTSFTAGSTIPIKFTLSYLNGSPMLVGDINVTISGGSLAEPLVFPFGTKGDDIVRFDEETQHYILTLHTKTKEYKLGPGEYQIQVNLDEEIVGEGNPSLLGQTTFTLAEKGSPTPEFTPTPTATPTTEPSPSPTAEISPSPTPESTLSPTPEPSPTPSPETTP